MNVANVVFGQRLREIGKEDERRGRRGYLRAIPELHPAAPAMRWRLVSQKRFERLIDLRRRDAFVPHILNLEDLVEAFSDALARQGRREHDRHPLEVRSPQAEFLFRTWPPSYGPSRPSPICWRRE